MPDISSPASAPPLTGLRVVDLSTTLPGAICSQYLADSGADVVMVEPPGGSPVRTLRGWPVLGRGKRSRVADLKTAEGSAVLDQELAGADVLITTYSPHGLVQLGIDAEELAQRYPHLVIVHITGWGRTGPWRDLKGYEGLIFAKTGLSYATRRMQNPPQSSFVTVPYASYAAAHIALHGILSALHDRHTTGLGQVVDADLVRGIHSIDAWNWFGEMVGLRWPEAYSVVDAWTPQGTPQSPVLLAILTAPTKDGHWLQFAQVSPHLFQAMLTEFGVLPLLADPKWTGFPALEDPALFKEFWGILLSKVRERTLAEWQQCFAANPNLSAELFRAGPQVLDHPQLIHERRSVVVNDPEVGPVRQPTTLIHTPQGPLQHPGPAPRVGENTGGDTSTQKPAARSGSDVAGLPLAGITILEFGEMFAAPYASSVLADLGARVIKFEAMSGDSIRSLLPFPETAGAKVMQGKESIQVDLHTDDGRAIAHRLVETADVVLQSMRAGAADRLGIGAENLLAINAELIYVSAPGYGNDGPFGTRPAYAPSIAAAGGIALTNTPDAMSATGSLEEIMHSAPRITTAGTSPELQCDGLAALSVASAMLTSLVGRDRGLPVSEVRTSMLATVTHVLADWIAEYADAPVPLAPTHGGAGLSAVYRMYDAVDGRIFLAAPQTKEWPTLVQALREFTDLTDDERFATPESRTRHDDALAERLGQLFTKESAAFWEQHLATAGVGCVVVHEGAPARLIQEDPALAAEYAVEAMSPTFDQHLRFAPLVGLSRSLTRAPGGCLAGQHTEQILKEFGFSDAAIASWRDAGVIHIG